MGHGTASYTCRLLQIIANNFWRFVLGVPHFSPFVGRLSCAFSEIDRRYSSRVNPRIIVDYGTLAVVLVGVMFA